MEEQTLPPAPSIGTTILNVFTAPSEAFAGLDKAESKPSLWIIPLLISILAVILSIVIGSTNESLKEQRLEAARSVLEKRVDEGKMTQEQFDRAMEGMEQGKGAGFMLIAQIVGVTIFYSIIFFLIALILWLASKLVLKTTANYEKILELSGIASWITILGIIVQILMMLGLNSIYAQPSLSLFIYNSYDPMNSTHRFLSMINFFSIWNTIVIGIGLSKWCEKGTTLAMIVAFAIWLISIGLMYALGMAA